MHMKFWNQAQLCLAIYDFEAHITALCLTFQGTELRENTGSAPAKYELGGQNEKLETYGYNFRSLWQ